ncbi:hypothetical protein D0466_18880 [Peribacillus glennii]|uniref:Uncharacterized protein n=1 Tax=Peribacillus glennii TaxID=2303991 RepID=A0A372L9M3_9BACI|nr:hypothetical protein D0466_18880 [Peribacillus glennii]
MLKIEPLMSFLLKIYPDLPENSGLCYKIRNLAERAGIHIITLDNAINSLTGNGSTFGLYTWVAFKVQIYPHKINPTKSLHFSLK